MKSHGPLSVCIWLKTSISVWLRRVRQRSNYGRSSKLSTKNNPPHWNLYWFESCTKWRWERPIDDFQSGVIWAFLSGDQLRRRSKSPHVTLEPIGELGGILHDFRQQLPVSWIWTKQSAKSSRRIFGENQWDSPSMNQRKPTNLSAQPFEKTRWENLSKLESTETLGRPTTVEVEE